MKALRSLPPKLLGLGFDDCITRGRCGAECGIRRRDSSEVGKRMTLTCAVVSDLQRLVRSEDLDVSGL
jgi:hypothetical protein